MYLSALSRFYRNSGIFCSAQVAGWTPPVVVSRSVSSFRKIMSPRLGTNHPDQVEGYRMTAFANVIAAPGALRRSTDLPPRPLRTSLMHGSPTSAHRGFQVVGGCTFTKCSILTTRLRHGIQPDLQRGIDREANFLATRQKIGKDGVAHGINSQANPHGRDHASGDSCGKAEFEVRP